MRVYTEAEMNEPFGSGTTPVDLGLGRNIVLVPWRNSYRYYAEVICTSSIFDSWMARLTCGICEKACTSAGGSIWIGGAAQRKQELKLFH